MNSLKIFLFLIIFPSSQGNDKYYQSIGVYTEETKENIFFKEGTITVYLSRHYASRCSTIKNEQFLNLRYCGSKKVDDKVKSILDAVEKECDAIWFRRMTQIGQLTSRIREKRQAAGYIIGTLHIFSSLIKSLTSIFSDMYHIYHEHKLIQNQDKLYIKGKDGSIIAANLAKNLNLDINELHDMMCDYRALSDINFVKIHANLLLQASIKSIEEEVLNFQFGILPKTVDFLTTAMEICSSIRGNSVEFCRYSIFNQEIGLKWDGLTTTKKSLVGLVKLKVPIMASDLAIESFITIKNIGMFSPTKNYMIVDLPDYAIKTKTGFIYEITSSTCSNKICHTNNVQQTVRSRCLFSITHEQTTLCQNIIKKTPHCYYLRVNGGHIIVAINAIFFPTDRNVLDAIKIANQTYFAKSPGRLLCDSLSGYNSSHILTEPYTSVKFNSTLQLMESVNIVKTINMSKMTSRLSQNLKLIHDLETLYKTDDKVAIGNKDINILNVIAFISTAITFSGLIILFIYRHRKKFTQLHCKTFQRMRLRIFKAKSTPQLTDQDIVTSRIDNMLVDNTNDVVYPITPQ